MTTANKEKNFISAVVYLRNNGNDAATFLKRLDGILNEHFEKYELIAVNDACTDDTVTLVKEWANGLTHPLTLVNMSLHQGKESCMNAGLDAAIGDYVYEFDSVAMPYNESMIYEAYLTATKGNDIVSVCPDKMKKTSRWFYSVFNRSSHSIYRLRSTAFRLLTRRAVNRVHNSSAYLPYRKASYAASGLKMANIEFPGEVNQQKERASLAINSLILYTNAGVLVSLACAVFMFIMTLLEFAYVVVIYLTGHPVEGWTPIMMALTTGLCGIFGIMTIVIKYLSLLLELGFKKQKYLIESVEKIQK